MADFHQTFHKLHSFPPPSKGSVRREKDIKMSKEGLNTDRLGDGGWGLFFGVYALLFIDTVTALGRAVCGQPAWTKWLQPASSPLLAPAPLSHAREAERWAAAGGPFTDGCRYNATLG